MTRSGRRVTLDLGRSFFSTGCNSPSCHLHTPDPVTHRHTPSLYPPLPASHIQPHTHWRTFSVILPNIKGQGHIWWPSEVMAVWVAALVVMATGRYRYVSSRLTCFEMGKLVLEGGWWWGSIRFYGMFRWGLWRQISVGGGHSNGRSGTFRVLRGLKVNMLGGACQGSCIHGYRVVGRYM